MPFVKQIIGNIFVVVVVVVVIVVTVVVIVIVGFIVDVAPVVRVFDPVTHKSVIQHVYCSANRPIRCRGRRVGVLNGFK